MTKCQPWKGTYTVKGYPQAKIAGKTYRAHRLACEAAHGAPPTLEHQAAHSCGNRACVNPDHLYWATPLENNRDRYKHGTAPLGERSGTAKLSAAKVKRIRRSQDTQTALAEKFGVSQTTIWACQARKTWAHIA